MASEGKVSSIGFPKCCGLFVNRKGVLALLGIVLVSTSFFLSWSNFSSHPNVDDVAHLPAGISHWKFQRFDLYRVNPPLVRFVNTFPSFVLGEQFDWKLYSASIGRRPEFAIGPKKLRESGVSYSYSFILPRVVNSVVMAAALFWFCCLIGSSVSRSSAFILGAYFVFNANLLACFPTIGPDGISTVLGAITCCSFAIMFWEQSLRRLAYSGVTMGLVLLSKLTWISLFFSLPLTAFINLLVLNKYMPQKSESRILLMNVQAFFFSLFILASGYLFEEVGQKLGDFEFCSKALGGPNSDAISHGNRFRGTWMANLPIPVPRNYLQGIDYLRFEVEDKRWSFLNGEWRFGSWPHYYIMTTLYKTPEPTLLGALIGLGVLITGIRRGMVKPEVISMFLFLIIPAAVCFASVSLQGGFNHHHRYVLMIYPPMFALAAYIASPVGVELLRFRFPFLGREKRSIAIPLAITLVTLSAVSTLRVHPYYTSYFNTLSGGPENGWHRLGFSNIDWGQDILEVDQWLKKYPERRPLVMDIDYFGMNGDLFDVPTSLPPQLPLGASIDEVRRSITETQWWIISVKRLYNLPDQPGLQYLQQIEPVERIAYAYHVYRIDPLPPEESSSPNEPIP